MTGRGTLALDAAVPLGYTLILRAATDLGGRALAIKGPVPQAHGLRPDRQSVDIDVLVAPDDRDRVRDRLVELGWSRQVGATEAPVFEPHSIALSHPAWPCHLDLHHRFPGFLADADTVFDALWDERTEITVAGQPVAATGIAGSTLILALHALRQTGSPAMRAELDAAAEHWAAHGTDADRAVLRTLAEVTGAAALAAPFLARIGVVVDVPDDPATRAALEEWRIRNEVGADTGLGWFLLLARASPLRWPGLLWRALMANESVLRDYGMAADGSGAWAARWRRLRRVARTAPGTARLMWHERRSLSVLQRWRSR
ncbi:nucleotidyltransferase family protein [Nocardioides caeni]|uniref:nucleotidyltransferase family protein n=1 Tax=Nocardioides caeni TaxID=574700 RepID=UPI0013050F20|nr:nucleotidyltransferase family protein [Nocardioides caeni]